MPVTTYSIMAANRMLDPRGGIFRSLFKVEDHKGKADLEEAKEEIIKRFGEAVKTPEDMAKAHKKLAETAENVMKTMIDSEEITSEDLRDMRILRRQIALGTRMTKEEHYAIPVLVADELTNVQLKIVRGKEEKGRVDVLFETPKLGKVAARFQVNGDRMKGWIASDSHRTIEEIGERKGNFEQLDLEDGMECSLDLIHSGNLDLNRLASAKEEQANVPEPGSESYQVQTKTLYGIARGFLEEIKQMGQNLS